MNSKKSEIPKSPAQLSARRLSHDEPTPRLGKIMEKQEADIPPLDLHIDDPITTSLHSRLDYIAKHDKDLAVSIVSNICGGDPEKIFEAFTRLIDRRMN